MLERDDYFQLLREKHSNDPDFITDELLKKGLAPEEQSEDFFAVDVSPTMDQTAIDDYQRGERRAGRWEMQDGYLDGVVTAYRQRNLK